MVASLLTTVARADSAVLLPPQGDERLVQVRELAQAALRDALSDQRVKLVRHPQGESDGACQRIDCAGQLAQLAGVSFVVALAIWADERGEPQSAFVTLVDAKGVRFPGRAAVNSDDVEGAALAALLDARSLQLLGPGPWLRVHGKPEGAAVYLDGKRVGSLPFRVAKRSGRYALEVRAPGHRSHIQSVDVPPNGARQVEVEAELRPGSGARSAAPSDSAPGDPVTTVTRRPVLGPLLLAGAGAVAIGIDVALIAGAGCDRPEPDGACTRRTEVESGPAAAWAVVGVAGLGGALLWHLLGTTEVRVVDDMSLRLGSDLTFTGSF